MGTVTRKVVESICYVDKAHKCLTSQMKAVEKYFHVAIRPYFYISYPSNRHSLLFLLYMCRDNFESVLELDTFSKDDIITSLVTKTTQ